jgi:hypothetical protein
VVCDQDGSTALLVACAKGHLDVVRFLVTDAGSDARLERTKVSCGSTMSPVFRCCAVSDDVVLCVAI